MSRHASMHRAGFAAAVASLITAALVSGCAVGPDFKAPARPDVARFTASALPDSLTGAEYTGSRAQGFVDVTQTPLDWWTVFGSTELDGLVARALKQSPTIASAEAALRQAQELAAAQRGGFFPSVQAGYSPTRARTPDATSSPLSSGASVYTLHTAQISVGYTVDVFGGNQRAVESLEAQSELQAWQLQAARLTLAANVVTAALQRVSLNDQLTVTQKLGGIAQKQWTLLKAQQRLGAASGAAVLAQEILWRQTEAIAANLRKQLAQQLDLLAVLVGTTAADLQAPAFELSALRLPDVPTGLAARLVQQRPDVRAAQAQLHSANAEVGVAVANMLPQITLTANFGSAVESLGQLFRAGGLLWGVGANLVQPVFQGGTLLHRKLAAEAQFDQNLAQYRSTVLNAFQNVADSLEAVRHDADQHLAASQQASLSEKALQIAQRQLELGDINSLALLNAETAYLQAAVGRIQAETSRYTDVAAVYLALGGSWADKPIATITVK